MVKPMDRNDETLVSFAGVKHVCCVVALMPVIPGSWRHNVMIDACSGDGAAAMVLSAAPEDGPGLIAWRLDYRIAAARIDSARISSVSRAL